MLNKLMNFNFPLITALFLTTSLEIQAKDMDPVPEKLTLHISISPDQIMQKRGTLSVLPTEIIWKIFERILLGESIMQRCYMGKQVGVEMGKINSTLHLVCKNFCDIMEEKLQTKKEKNNIAFSLHKFCLSFITRNEAFQIKMLRKLCLVYGHGEWLESKIILSIPITEDPTQFKFDLRRCGKDIDNMFSIQIGYRSEATEKEDKDQVWIVPWFIIARDINGPAAHFKEILSKWPTDVSIGIISNSGKNDPLSNYGYVVNRLTYEITNCGLDENFNYRKQTVGGSKMANNPLFFRLYVDR